MFGYFRPYHAKLTHTERQLFNAYYCRVCYCLRIVGGQLARFCTTYDAAIYSLIMALQSHEEAPPVLACERIGSGNLRLFANDEVGLKIARLTLISVGEKFRDDQIDSGSLKTKLISLPFKKAIERAKKAEPVIAQGSFEGTERINELQNASSPLAEVFSAYGDMAAASFSQFLDMSPETEELIRSVSEWNFFMDMLCDYESDYKSGTYNGFKKEGLATFAAYFSVHYNEFLTVAKAVTDRLVTAILAVRDDSTIWNTLFKIIIHAVDNVLPDAIEGKDVSFHYFPDLFERIKENRSMDSDIKRLRIHRDEKS